MSHIRCSVVRTQPRRPTLVDTKAALNGYKRQLLDVGPNNAARCEAHMTFRETRRRVSGTEFMKFLASRHETVSEGAVAAQEVWAVPKGNFLPGRMPQHIFDAIACEANCIGVRCDRELFT